MKGRNHGIWKFQKILEARKHKYLAADVIIAI